MKSIPLWGLLLGAIILIQHERVNWGYRPPAPPLTAQQIRLQIGAPLGPVQIGGNPGQVTGQAPEAPKKIEACNNSGRAGSDAKPANCSCAMGCNPNDPHGFGSPDGKSRCKTYCRINACSCKLAPCP